jgi:hypothetical protein
MAVVGAPSTGAPTTVWPSCRGPSEAVVPAGHYRWREPTILADLRTVCLNARKRALPAPEAFDRHVGAATSIMIAA